MSYATKGTLAMKDATRAEIEQNVLDAMQQAEEITGDMPVDEYLGLMRDIRNDAASRIANVCHDLSMGAYTDDQHDQSALKQDREPLPGRSVNAIMHAIHNIHTALWEHDENLAREFADQIELGTGNTAMIIRKFMARNV